MKPPTRPPLLRVLLRLFTVQGSWNYERMLGVGFGVAEEPLLRDLAGAGTRARETPYREAVARGSRFFNAHPYLCGLAVGAAARAENDGAPPAQIERLRTALCGPLGSLGDTLVWAGWLPFTSAVALAAVALGLGWWAVLGFLVIYNVGHVTLRSWALAAGWAHGLNVATALRHPGLQRSGAVLGPAMALGMGAALPLVASYLGGAFAAPLRLAIAVGVGGGVLLLRWSWLRLTGVRLGLVFLTVGLIVGLLWR
ncbi:MAG TPA: PTS system mannose/fructose/sorbose family transporter subunit IID [Gemmatimonadales bacterium]|nr:PTS system mannose/fructose/sorbose family transporter subunit IID [Gemmatimonadales bacterium]